MGKIETKVTYEGFLYNQVNESKGLKLFMTDDEEYCIIVDKNDDVVFKIRGEGGLGEGYLVDLT